MQKLIYELETMTSVPRDWELLGLRAELNPVSFILSSLQFFCSTTSKQTWQTTLKSYWRHSDSVQIDSNQTSSFYSRVISRLMEEICRWLRGFAGFTETFWFLSASLVSMWKTKTVCKVNGGHINNIHSLCWTGRTSAENLRKNSNCFIENYHLDIFKWKQKYLLFHGTIPVKSFI